MTMLWILFSLNVVWLIKKLLAKVTYLKGKYIINYLTKKKKKSYSEAWGHNFFIKKKKKSESKQKRLIIAILSGLNCNSTCSLETKIK